MKQRTRNFASQIEWNGKFYYSGTSSFIAYNAEASGLSVKTVEIIGSDYWSIHKDVHNGVAITIDGQVADKSKIATEAENRAFGGF